MTAPLRLLSSSALAVTFAFVLAFPSPSEGQPQGAQCRKGETSSCCSCCCHQEAPVCLCELQGKGYGRKGRGKGKEDHQVDRQTFQYLLAHRKEITRKVTDLANGVETVTESKNREVAAKIQEHAAAMHRRLEEGRPIHMRDPLFREIFRHADKIQMRVEKTARGVKVRETSADAYVASLIQAHARVVSAFLAKGHEEVRKDHPIPARPKGK